jgi:hypothetical protein
MSMSLDAAVAFSARSTQDSDGGDGGDDGNDEGDVCRFLELQYGSSTVLYVPY